MVKSNVKQAELVRVKLMRASEAIQISAEVLFKSHGLSGPQYNVLRILRGAGNGGLRCQEISGRMLKRVPDITRLLDRLVDKGLVERSRSANDRRVVISVITSRGQALLAAIDGPLANQVADQFTTFSPGQITRLESLLDRLLTDLDA